MFGIGKKKQTKRDIVINCESLETRVAVLENGRLEEFLVEHPTEERIVGSVFKGRIQNLEHDLQAAFVDIGMKKNAFLHYWDMIAEDGAGIYLDEEETGQRKKSRKKRYSNEEITKRFPPGSDIIVQVTKGAIGTKGPRVTANLSIPGRYLVMMPGAGLHGVSRKIEDARERAKIRKVLSRLPIPNDIGIIARTAAAEASKRSFARDIRALTATWHDLRDAIRDRPSPSVVYQEPDLGQRVVRDWLTEDVDRVHVDNPEEYEKIRTLAANISRSARSRINLYEGELPIFDHYNVEQQLEQAMRRKVTLESGGYIILEETEAMIVIDVNSGRHKGKGSQEEAILEINTDAVEEVARQLRLRNIGGLVVIDLIDMKPKRHQSAVLRTLKAALKRDRARTNVLPISPLGILEMTRQRMEESILSSMYVDCPYCRGRGAVKSPLGMSVDIQRQISAVLRRMKREEKSGDLVVVVHPTVLDRLRREDEKFLLALQDQFDGSLRFKPDPGKHVEFFSINDGDTGAVLFTSVERG